MSKPSTSATINSGDSRTTNLSAAFLLNEGTGTTTKDYVTGTLALTLAGSASWSSNGITLAAASARAGATTPAALKLALPITVYLRLIPTATAPSANCSVFGISHNTAGTSPFTSAVIASGTLPQYQGNFNSAGTFSHIASAANFTTDAGTATDIALVMTATGHTLYRNGTSIGTATGAKSNPTYGATSPVGFGDLFVSSLNAHCEVVFGYIFAADMSASLASLQADGGYGMFSEPSGGPLISRSRIVNAGGIGSGGSRSRLVNA
jgi:hypothetical protein